ncbi:NERD domain-containing protein [Chloroflexota bacterium]
MARIYEGSGAEDTTSPAEKDLIERFEKLPDDFTIIHSARWLSYGANAKEGEGEADFVIVHPVRGLLVMEVKGGVEIWMTREKNAAGRYVNQWYSKDRYGNDHKISDPFHQADKCRYALLDWLKNDPRTKAYDYRHGSAVAFPDTGLTGNIRPGAPREIVLDMSRVDTLERSLLDVYDYWKERTQEKYRKPIGQDAVDALVDLLVPTRKLSVRIGDVFERERRKIEELTQQQYRVLRMLNKHRQAAIVGGAGTGKTMLAMEKAQQLADAGQRVLFLCYNRNLQTWLEKAIGSEQITVTTFHGITGKAVNWAQTKMPVGSSFYEQAPDALLDAAEALHLMGGPAAEKLFDAIIVDEAQDFEESWWIPLPELLKEPKDGIFYVFFDNNQRIYTQLANMPFQGDPFQLDENCRNTRSIHDAMTPFTAVDDDKTVCLGPQGREIEQVPAGDEKEARKSLESVLNRLVEDAGVPAKDIVLLTTRSEEKSQWKSDTLVGKHILTWDMDSEMKNAINVCTIYRYKGLESPVIILAELDQAKEGVANQLVYVGLSRARNHAVVLGELPEPVA